MSQRFQGVSTTPRNVEKPDRPVEEGLHGDLVGRVEDSWAAAALMQGFPGQPERREALRIRRREVRRPSAARSSRGVGADIRLGQPSA